MFISSFVDAVKLPKKLISKHEAYKRGRKLING